MKANTVLGVAGCMAQRLGPRLLERADHVSLVVGPDGYRALPTLIENARRGQRTASTSFDLEEHYEDFSARRFDGVKAWIPVQRGCDYRCTYCIVPYTRGPERSRRLADVVREVRAGGGAGITEIVLLGQTVNSYNDGTHDFADLLRAVGASTGCGAALHQPASQRLLGARDRRHGRGGRRCASTCTCPCRAAPRACSSACCAATRARSTSLRGAAAHRMPSLAHHRRHRRLPG
jgi:hypothetical protein